MSTMGVQRNSMEKAVVSPGTWKVLNAYIFSSVDQTHNRHPQTDWQGTEVVWQSLATVSCHEAREASLGHLGHKGFIRVRLVLWLRKFPNLPCLLTSVHGWDRMNFLSLPWWDKPYFFHTGGHFYLLLFQYLLLFLVM